MCDFPTMTPPFRRVLLPIGAVEGRVWRRNPLYLTLHVAFQRWCPKCFVKRRQRFMAAVRVARGLAQE